MPANFVLAFLAALLCSTAVNAQGTVTLADDEEENGDVAPASISDSTTSSPQLATLSILPKITESIGPLAAHNLTNPEQVFCYQIAQPPENYQGYTLNGMAIVGFCGVISPKVQQLISDKLLNNSESIVFDKVENCAIRPQIMLRYIRGVDATDVLLSSPCHALATFYGGNIKIFNAKPAAYAIDSIIKPLINKKVEFVSPALFNQSLPVGVAKTDEQKQLLQKQNEPIRKWEQKQQEQAVKTSGWNKLKSN